jgi:hypothetical protein
MFKEMDEMFKRVDSKIESKSFHVHQVYERNRIAIEKQFERQKIAENFAKRADDMAIMLRQNLAAKISEINERMSLYRTSPRWLEMCGEFKTINAERVKRLVLFGLFNSFLGYDKSSRVLAKNCNQFFMCIFEREAIEPDFLPYVNSLKFFKLNWNMQILCLRGYFNYEIDAVFALNNNLSLVFLTEVSNPTETLFIVVNAASQVLATQMLEFDAQDSAYKVATPSHVDRIVIHYWWKGIRHTCVLDYKLNFLFLEETCALRASDRMLISNNLICLQLYNQFIFYDFFLNLRGKHTIDTRYKSYKMCQFNKDFVYLNKRKVVYKGFSSDLTTISFIIYDYKKDCCFKDFYMNFHDSSIPRMFAFQFDIFSNFYVYNYANELKVYDKYGSSIKVVQSRDVSNNETLDDFYEERCNVESWSISKDTPNFKKIYIINGNNIFQ